MADPYIRSIMPIVLDEWRDRSKARIYRTDPEAWVNDVLGKRWWRKQAEIGADYVSDERIAVKSANGTGKSFMVSDLICHWVSVYPIDEALAIISAPSVDQIERVIFAYLKDNYGYAATHGTPLRGWINEDMEWKYKSAYAGNQFLAFGKKPSDQNIIGSFQGTRKQRTAVFIDEAGAVPEGLFVAAEAVTTGTGNRIIAIGNPDTRGTHFFKLFNDKELAQDWKLHTISAFDLPTFTGEIVYPDDPVRQEAMLTSGMNSPDTIEPWRRAWGEGSARWLSKVLGEFPGEDDSTFFPQETINTATDTRIDPDDDALLFLGCDIARFGQDETVVYSNHGGKIRFVEAWSKTDNIETARRIHKLATELGADEVRVDSAGTGSGTYDALNVLEEFDRKTYELIGLLGANASPNKNLWMNARAWHYDKFREGMKNGDIDLDGGDKNLQDELLMQTFKFNNRNALQISSKKEMREAGLKSPDYLDAAIYSYVDWAAIENPNEPQNGEKTAGDPEKMLEQMTAEFFADAGLPG
jgi:hypothetical protein